jgi:hypothetical protein
MSLDKQLEKEIESNINNNPFHYVELWKPIKIHGKETQYEVSDHGRIKFKNNKNRFLKPFNNSDGYKTIKVYNGKQQASIVVHRLVAEAFIPNPDGKPQVNHINGIKTDNRVENLEWVTAKENVRHAWKNGLCKPSNGANNGNNIFDEKIVHQICKLLEEKNSALEISKLLGIKKSLVDSIKGELSWKHISKNYDLAKVIHRTTTRSKNIKLKIIELLSRDLDYSEILSLVGLPDIPINRIYVSGIKYNLKRLKEQSSTTIPKGSTTISL